MKSRLVPLFLLGAASVAGAVPRVAGPDPDGVAVDEAATLAPSDPRELEVALGAVERDERELKRTLRELEQRDEVARARSVAFGRAYVRAVRSGLLPVAGGFDAFVDHAARVERLRKAAARELEERKRIATHLTVVRRRLTDTGSRLAVLHANQQAMAQAHEALLAAQDREAAFERAFSSSSGHAAVYGSGAGPMDPALVARGFAAQKGSLMFPIVGRTEIRPARRPGIDGPGLEIAAPVGSPVRAIFPGRVAFADEYGAYGRTVIIDHGDRYFSVSAGLASTSVEVEDEVGAGTTIGAVGIGPDGPGLYFELRLGAETLDPDVWMGL